MSSELKFQSEEPVGNSEEPEKAAVVTKKKTKKKKKKSSAPNSRVYPMPDVISVDSSDYRVKPGVSVHPFVSGELMNELFWDLPDFPVERNYLKRLGEANVQHVLSRTWQDHLVITITTRIPNATELAAGMYKIESWLEDGHHRREWWRRQIEAGNVDSVPSSIIVIEHVVDNDTELYDTYYHYNSEDSVEKIEHKLDAMINEIAPIDPNTGKEWVRKCQFAKNANLLTILNRVSQTTGPSNERFRTWDAKTDSTTGRSKSQISNDIAKQLLVRYMNDLIALDDFLSDRMEGDHGLKKMTKGGKVENVKGCRGKVLYDTATRVALMVMFRACGNTWHPNIVEAFDKYFDNWSFVGDAEEVENANMEYNMNRCIRDATPHKAEDMSEPTSDHLRFKIRDERARFHFGLADTIHNLTAIVLHGPEAKIGAHDEWHSDKTETYAWFQNFIEHSQKTPLK